MERDFLGLKWKESSFQNLKQISKISTVNDSVSRMQWWWSEYSSGSPSELHQPFIATQDSSLTSPPVFANFDYNSTDNHSKPVSTLPKTKNFYRPWKFPFQQDKTVLPVSNNNQFLRGFPVPGWRSSISSTLFPTDPRRNKSKQIVKAAESEGRLTIIYDNEVYVFEDISPDKAKAIMRVAEEKYNSCFTAEDDMKQVAAEQISLTEPATASVINSTIPNNFPATATTTPLLARKATLEHFIDKRKDRLMTSSSKGMNI